MGYVAIKGGGTAIREAAHLQDFLRCSQPQGDPLSIDDINHQLHALRDRVISEGGLYHPDLAALSIKQSCGDSLEASFALRAFRSTRPRLLETDVHLGQDMRLIRRISSAFKDIPGGQMLGPTNDYALRLLKMELLDEESTIFKTMRDRWLESLPEEDRPTTFPKVLDALRRDGLLASLAENQNHDEPFDITREPLIFPVPRSASLATMARAETGGLLAIAYSNMRGYGDVHPTVGELRVGYLPVYVPHLVTGEPVEIGEVLVTECEVIAMYEADTDQQQPTFSIGYGACFGHNEVKAISMAVLDRSLQIGMKQGASNPSEDQEFVLLHIDGIDSMGFCSHYKMPHYVTFQSDMDRLRTTQKKFEDK